VAEPSPRFRRRNLWLAAAAIVLLLPVVEKAYLDCAACGLKRREYRLCGVPILARDSATECSDWYVAHFGPETGHTWVQGTWAETRALCGIPYGGSNLAGRATGPLVQFGPGIRKLMYETFPDPAATRSMFLTLSHWERDGTPERERQREVTWQLHQWENTGMIPPHIGERSGAAP
jgi:hypothetical protein